MNFYRKDAKNAKKPDSPQSHQGTNCNVGARCNVPLPRVFVPWWLTLRTLRLCGKNSWWNVSYNGLKHKTNLT